jgi:hypothetical protein
LFRTIASSRPTKNERKTVDAAKTIVQMKIRKNGPRSALLARIVPKLWKPIVVFHPGSSSWSAWTN